VYRPTWKKLELWCISFSEIMQKIFKRLIFNILGRDEELK